jgi:hypothetical protein
MQPAGAGQRIKTRSKNDGIFLDLHLCRASDRRAEKAAKEAHNTNRDREQQLRPQADTHHEALAVLQRVHERPCAIPLHDHGLSRHGSQGRKEGP